MGFRSSQPDPSDTALRAAKRGREEPWDPGEDPGGGVRRVGRGLPSPARTLLLHSSQKTLPAHTVSPCAKFHTRRLQAGMGGPEPKRLLAGIPNVRPRLGRGCAPTPGSPW